MFTIVPLPLVRFLCVLIFALGVYLAVTTHDFTHISRVGNFIIALGVWMTLRGTLREGLKRHHDLNDNLPVISGSGPAQMLNITYINNLTFRRGDAKLQLIGFAITLIGSILASYGDILFAAIYCWL